MDLEQEASLDPPEDLPSGMGRGQVQLGQHDLATSHQVQPGPWPCEAEVAGDDGHLAVHLHFRRSLPTSAADLDMAFDVLQDSRLPYLLQIKKFTILKVNTHLQNIVTPLLTRKVC